MTCPSGVHPDYTFSLGNCNLKKFGFSFSLDSTKTELTITFDKEPTTFTVAGNTMISTDSGWTEGTDYTVTLVKMSTFIKKLIFAYSASNVNQTITVVVHSVMTKVGTTLFDYHYTTNSKVYSLESTVDQPLSSSIDSPLASSPDENSKSDSPFGLSPNAEAAIQSTSTSIANYGQYISIFTSSLQSLVVQLNLAKIVSLAPIQFDKKFQKVLKLFASHSDRDWISKYITK